MIRIYMKTPGILLIIDIDPTLSSRVEDSQTSRDRPPARTPLPLLTEEFGVDDTDEIPLDVVDHVAQTPKQLPVRRQDASQDKVVTVLSVAQLRSKIEDLWNLDVVDMFSSGRPGDDIMLEKHAMMLYSPQDHSQELELITRWLLIHNVKVNSLWQDGSWAKFREDVAKDKSGIIIVRSMDGVACCTHTNDRRHTRILTTILISPGLASFSSGECVFGLSVYNHLLGMSLV